MKMNVTNLTYHAVEKVLRDSAAKFEGFSSNGFEVFVEVTKPVESSIQFVSFV